MYQIVTFECAAGANTFYVPVPVPCKLAGARYCADANQAGTKTCVISKKGGNTIVSGDINATAGTVTEGTITSTEADKNQAFAITDVIQVAINLTGGTAGTVAMVLDLDEFKHTH
jgi:hypothetical protein